MMWWIDGADGWVLMTVVMVIFWGLVLFGILAIFRGTRGVRLAPTRQPEHDPKRLLDERFARAEIDADEYHVRQDVLRTLR